MIEIAPYSIHIMIFIIGLVMGSFLNVVIYRIPKGQSIVSPSSRCTSCHQSIKYYHNIPIFSWVYLRGKCAYCQAKISSQYPVIELATALIWVLIYQKIGPVWYCPFVIASFTALLALSLIDIKYYAVPDSINFFALATALVKPEYLYALRDALIAAFGLWLLAKIVSLVTRKESMGSADIIVAGTMAALLGFPYFFVAMFLASIVAIIPSLLAKDTMVPFVPFLSFGTIIVYLYQPQADQLLQWIMYAQD